MPDKKIRKKKGEKMVNTTICPICGNDATGGKQGLCASCYAAKEEGKPETKTKTKKTKEVSKQLDLDFSEYPDLYDILAKKAKQEIRPVWMQALYEIKQQMENGAEA
jgi:hypothetical protein